MDLSIVILNYFNKDLIRELLKNIAELKLPHSYEIIVVDNASYDGVEEIVKEYPQAKFIQNKKNSGFAAGNNLGIKQAQGKYILILNPDLAILSDAVNIMYQYLEDNPQVGLCGPRLINADKTIQYSCTRFPDWRLPLYRRTTLAETKAGQDWLNYYFLKDHDHHQNFPVPALFGACLLVRSAALEKVGLLDERYFMYLEDIDWCRRFWQAGWQVAYVGQAEVIHLHRRQSAAENVLKTAFSKYSRQHILSFIKYFWKFRGQKLPEVK